MKAQLSREKLSDDELYQIVFYAGEAICHPDPNYALEFEKLSHPSNVLALANEVIASRMLLEGIDSRPVYFVEIEGDQDINAGRIEGKDRPDLGLLPDGINYLYAAPPALLVVPDAVFRAAYELHLNGVLCGDNNKQAALSFLNACRITSDGHHG
jgi:hypothetical protein